MIQKLVGSNTSLTKAVATLDSRLLLFMLSR
jgi:hypothetical protein